MHQTKNHPDPAIETLDDQVTAARAVQNRLLRTPPSSLRALEVGVHYRPALGVGGDFYDLFPVGSTRLGILLGDIAGKGVSAAILMASLQATLRSHYAAATGDLPQVLRSVNRLFHDWTDPHHFATLFLGEYDEQTQTLSYANCGHLPPVLLRANGSVERLHATATVVGILEDWTCRVNKVRLEPGDTLLLFTDGMTEGRNGLGAEFGEKRLIHALRRAGHLSLPSLVDRVVRAQRTFCGFRAGDDCTLVAVRARARLELVQ